ncbi:MAG: hypothetical protein WAqPseu_28470 [Shewanella algae]
MPHPLNKHMLLDWFSAALQTCRKCMWHGESSVPAGSVLIDVEGEKDGPNVHALTQAKSILAELDRIKIEATAYIESE